MELFAWLSFAVAVALGFVALAMSFKIYRLGEDLTHVRGQRDRISEGRMSVGDELLAARKDLRTAAAKIEQLEKSLKLSEEAVAAGYVKVKELAEANLAANAARDEAKKSQLYWKEQAEQARAENKPAAAMKSPGGPPPEKAKAKADPA